MPSKSEAAISMTLVEISSLDAPWRDEPFSYHFGRAANMVGSSMRDDRSCRRRRHAGTMRMLGLRINLGVKAGLSDRILNCQD